MIILPDQRASRSLILPPQLKREWCEPSQRLTLSGIENRTWFSVEALTSDGVRFWRGWFEDHDDADAFMLHLVRHQTCGDPMPQDIARLPQLPRGMHTPLYSGWYPSRHYGEWRQEWSELPLSYNFATVSFLTAPTGSSTYTSDSSWNSSSNFIEVLAGGGAGGVCSNSATSQAAGGGAGGYSKTINFPFAAPGTTTAAIWIGAAGAGAASTVSTANTGNAGGDTWFNGASLGASTVGAEHGFGGSAATTNGPHSGGAGGATANGTGSTKNAGGKGGNTVSGAASGAAGGGGAGGPNGAGNQGVDLASTTGGNGGSGDAGSGGTAGTGNNQTGTPVNAGAGGGGTEWDGSHGSGGGGGGARGISSTAANGGAGGLYGAGGGGARGGAGATATSGSGTQGIIVLTWTPSGGGAMLLWFNSRMRN